MPQAVLDGHAQGAQSDDASPPGDPAERVRPGGHAGKDTRDGPIVVERLGTTDIGAVADILALAFLDERAFSHALAAPPRRRLRLLTPFFHGLVRGYASFGELHGARLDGRLVGAGIRIPPGRWPLWRRDRITSTLWISLGLLPLLAADPRAVRSFFTGIAELERHHPHDRPHWYLAFVGVHPAFRRQGVATALARYVLDQADRAGVGCYFETSGEGTAALYRRLGFEERETIEPLPGGPTWWTMWREPHARPTAPGDPAP